MNSYKFLEEKQKWEKLLHAGKLSPASQEILKKHAEFMGKDAKGRSYEDRLARKIYYGAVKKMKKLGAFGVSIDRSGHPIESGTDGYSAHIPKFKKYGKNTPLQMALIANHEANEAIAARKYQNKIQNMFMNSKVGKELSKKYADQFLFGFGPKPRRGQKVKDLTHEPTVNALNVALAPHGHMPTVLAKDGKINKLIKNATGIDIGSKDMPMGWVGDKPIYRSKVEQRWMNTSGKKELKARQRSIKRFIDKIANNDEIAKNIHNSKFKHLGNPIGAKDRKSIGRYVSRHPDAMKKDMEG